MLLWYFLSSLSFFRFYCVNDASQEEVECYGCELKERKKIIVAWFFYSYFTAFFRNGTFFKYIKIYTCATKDDWKELLVITRYDNFFVYRLSDTNEQEEFTWLYRHQRDRDTRTLAQSNATLNLRHKVSLSIDYRWQPLKWVNWTFNSIIRTSLIVLKSGLQVSMTKILTAQQLYSNGWCSHLT